jgi:hypothetical protein
MTDQAKGIWVAIITTVGGIIIALIANVGTKQPPSDIQYAGRVIDKQTQQAVQGAHVSVDTQGPPQNYYTDANGIFYTILKPGIQVVHIRVEADGYKIFDGNVAPASRTGLEDIRLERPGGGVSVGLPGGLTLKNAIEFVATHGKFGVQYIGSCNQQFMQTKVQAGEFRGNDWGTIIDQLQFRLINSKSKSGYRVTKFQERGVYQIECTN